ncbi:hypothetical protein OB955_15330 [Halobacteria archaeon AArc-m2/3/4]|uniref:Uncharacterized protein n=1 Tax=Natronoglomus mannanivorans TaxID=2979990 RepID=A0AAP3E3R7_9EURY|nr:hypothetical protein [Halobacteria archaeon AArc-xg1-1]MCU4974101.1 hypothetical protein [Halobacteria archaeon AArc-m2/3/4]
MVALGLRERIDTGFATSRSRYIGAGHVLGAGLLNVAIGLVMVLSIGSEAAFLSFVSVLERWWTESVLLEHGDRLAFVVSVVVPVGGPFVLLVGLWQLIAGVGAAVGKRYTMTMASTAVGSVTIVTIPLCTIAAVLLWCSREQFRDRSENRSVDS